MPTAPTSFAVSPYDEQYFFSLPRPQAVQRPLAAGLFHESSESQSSLSSEEIHSGDLSFITADEVDHPLMFSTVYEMFAERNDAVRHATPISEVELDSLIQYVEATRKFSDFLEVPASLPAEWSLCSEGEEFDCFKSIDESTGIVRTRTWAHIRGVPPQTLFFILSDSQTRRMWDKHYAKFEPEWTDPADPRLDILDAVVSAPLGFANREFLEWRRTRLALSKGDPFAIYLRSWNESGAGRPVSKGAVRAEVWLSGYLISWWEEDGQVLGAQVMVMTQIDVKGLIPKYIVNALSSSAPRKWVKSVTAAAHAELAQRGVINPTQLSHEALNQMYQIQP